MRPEQGTGSALPGLCQQDLALQGHPVGFSIEPSAAAAQPPSPVCKEPGHGAAAPSFLAFLPWDTCPWNDPSQTTTALTQLLL